VVGTSTGEPGCETYSRMEREKRGLKNLKKTGTQEGCFRQVLGTHNQGSKKVREAKCKSLMGCKTQKTRRERQWCPCGMDLVKRWKDGPGKRLGNQRREGGQKTRDLFQGGKKEPNQGDGCFVRRGG